MKILHTADLHLGSKLESKFTKEISDKRKKEVLGTFGRMIEYAKRNEIKIIILSGDVFDADKPSIKDKNFFYSAVKNNPEIDFLYLNGNHDKEGSYTETDVPNLKTFTKESLTSYTYGNVCISGIEMNKENAETFYSEISLDEKMINILMLHGEASDSVGCDKVKIDLLKNRGIDYLALGHIHSFKSGKIDERGIYVNPGCPEGRGFDECGEKGFAVIDIDETLKYEFVPFSFRVIHDLKIDISDAKDLYEAIEIVKKKVNDIDRVDILNITLTGEVPADCDISESDIETQINDFFFTYVKNTTKTKIDVHDYDDDKSLIGEFIRNVNSSDKYSPEMKEKLIITGLKILNGREVK